MQKRDWKEFRESGLLWWVNRTLHLFGWAICLQVESDGSVSDVFPARVGFRGFPENSEDQGFITLSKYLKENGESIFDEASSE